MVAGTGFDRGRDSGPVEGACLVVIRPPGLDEEGLDMSVWSMFVGGRAGSGAVRGVVGCVVAVMALVVPSVASADLTISSGPDSNVSFSAGVYTATSTTANINSAGLETNLA